MTGDAIAVDAAPQGFGIRRAILIGSGLMLVVMMTEVLCCRSGLVLAIAGHRRPGELERQKYEKKDREPAAHGRDCISESLYRKSTAGCARRYPPPADMAPMSANTAIHMGALPKFPHPHFRESALFDRVEARRLTRFGQGIYLERSHDVRPHAWGIGRHARNGQASYRRLFGQHFLDGGGGHMAFHGVAADFRRMAARQQTDEAVTGL